jgi:hypothetical protein
MSNHNLFIHGADGAARQASNEEILAAAAGFPLIGPTRFPAMGTT